jgi:mono/diheme cytochrome c family protein
MLLGLTALMIGPLASAATPDRAAEGRAITSAFGAELKAALQSAMAEGGPLAAIKVCHQDAPRIATEAAARSGATVGRTSLRLRNPANAPDEHEQEVLEAFAAQLAAGATPPLSRVDTLQDGRVRFMSAIVAQPQCLACHGTDLQPPVAEAIDRLYPEDQARGYQPGDLRGAFTITWPAE